nr:non-ribosomal peptide synthetase [Pseudomonas daroniae]
MRLSYAQQRQWFLWQFDPHSTAYNIPMALRLKGALDVEALSKSLEALIQRHETLRTTFGQVGDQVVQMIHPPVPFILNVEPVEPASMDEREARLQAQVEEEVQRTFDLEKGPLLRVKLLRLEEDEHVLILTLHHIVSDGWSMPIMIDELIQLYQGYCTGHAVTLPALPIQYADYAIWQRHWMEAGEQERQLAYWQAQLEGEQPVLELPFDRPRQALQAHSGASLDIELEQGLATALGRLAQKSGVTLFMLLLASFQTLLHRYTGQHDIRIGVPIANRSRVETERLIGFFVNTQVLKARFDHGITFSELLQQVHATALAAQSYQDLPFEQLVEALHPERNLSHTPLFQVMYNYQTSRQGDRRQLPGLMMEHLSWARTSTQFDLTLNTFEHEGVISASLIYTKSLFDSSTIEQLGRHWLNLLKGIVEQPAQRVGQLPLLSHDERQLMLHDWKGADMDYPVSSSLHQLIEAQCTLDPEAVAVVFDSQTLSYRQLNQRANRLAHKLRELGVGPDVLVGVAAERSIEMVVALLAVLKAAGAYVPLDPEYPRDRLAYMIEDSGIGLLLTQEHLQGQLPIPEGVRCLELQSGQQWLEAYSEENPDNVIHASNLAYVIYTSGSTGRPKGAGNTHAALINRLCWMQRAYALDNSDVVLQKTPFSFDVSVWEFFWPLLTGACLVVEQPAAHREPERLIETINRFGVTTLHFVPSMLQAFMASETVETCTSIKRIICSGEALPVALSLQTLARLPQAGLYNLYGPTEVAIDVTHWTCSQEATNSVPIGVPIDNLKTHILSEHLQAVAPRTTGELYLGGAGLARGYHRRAALTAERFVPDAFDQSERGGGRLYRSGDLTRYRPDGVIEYMGRIDHQVKIRGMRIELGEIEATLQKHPGIREAVVIDIDRAGAKQLAAYLVPAPHQSSDTEALDRLRHGLRDHLKAVLPEHMVPTYLMFVAGLPLTANGKLDRKALPRPDGSHVQKNHVAPRSELEQQLAMVWMQVLNVENVGVLDNFFELGGHSLLALDVISHIRRLGWTASVKDLFQNPGLGEFAQVVTPADSHVETVIAANRIPHDCESLAPEMISLVELSEEEVRSIEAAVPGGAANIQDIYPLAPLQEGILFHHLMQSEGDIYITSQAVSFAQKADLEEFVDIFNQVIDRHDILRTAIVWEGLRNPVQVVYRKAVLSIEWLEFDQDTSVMAALENHVDSSCYRIDVRQAPLIKALAAYDPVLERYVLQVPNHHLVSDHTTLEIVVREISLIKQGRRHELTVPLPFRNYVAKARLGVSEAEHEAFFSEMLAGLEEPSIPFDLQNVHGNGSRIRETRKPVDHDLAAAIRVQAKRQGVSAASVFHLAWALVVAQTSGREDVVFGTVLFGRMQGGEGVERALGLFINTLPVRIRLDTDSVQQALKQTHATLTNLLQHEHASLGLAQKCSTLPKGAGLFSSLLNYRYSMKTQASDTEVTWHDMEVLGSKARNNYPITLSVDDSGSGFNLVSLVDETLDGASICRYMDTALRGIVQSLSADPDSPVVNISILCEADQLRILALSRGQACAFEVGSVYELFERHALACPDDMAVCHEGSKLTYGQLLQSVDELADRLFDHGVGAGDRVGIHAQRSIDFVIAMLAVLKGASTYVPLDPALPPDRLAYMATDSGLSILLSTAPPSWSTPLPVLLIEGKGADKPLSTRRDRARVAMSSHCPAYIIYTSGSTGRPKGVAVSQAALANYVQAIRTRIGLSPSLANFAMVSTVAADLGHTVLFGALCSGRCLHMIASDVTLDPDRFASYMRENEIDVLKIVPGHLQALLSAASPADVLPSTCLILGGEQIRTSLLTSIRTLKKTCRVLNHYGPTETTVGVLSQDLSDDYFALNTPLLGKPLANCEVYVLDARQRLVAPGVAGELYLGGAQLAQGYVGRAGHTAERFVASALHNGERLYRSADKARLLENGCIEFLGRLDDQVKIRGYRVETREIAELLKRQPGIVQAEVVAVESADGQKKLHAYVVAGLGVTVDTDYIRQRLTTELPDYMVPESIIGLDALPLNANGKLDRAALPLPDVQIRTTSEPAQGPVEQALAEVWSDVLGLQHVGRHDNFFELGGDSILTLQIIARLRKRGLKVSPKHLMQLQTVAAIAEVCTVLPGKTGADTVSRGTSASAGKTFELTPIQHWFFEQKIDARHHWNQSVMLTVTEVLDLVHLRAALETVIARHQALRLTFIRQDGRWQQTYGQANDLNPLEVVDLSGTPDIDSTITATADKAQRSLTLEKPFKAVWMDLGPARPGRLLLAAHHLIVDAVSWRIILDDLQVAYRQCCDGKAALLPDPETSLYEWSQMLRRYADSEGIRDELPYWRSVVDQDDPDLPGRVDGQNRVVDTRILEVALDEELTERLLTEAPHAYRTQINDLLLTALARALCAWAQRSSMLVEMEGHGRETLEESTDLSSTAGWFTTLFPVRLTPAADMGASIKAIKEQLRAVPGKGIGYGVLRYLTQEGRVLSRAAYPQVTFNYLGQLDQSFDSTSLWRLAREDAGAQRDPLSPRRTRLEVGALVHRGQLQISFKYSEHLHDESTIRQVAERFTSELKALIEHCTSGIVGVTPSDFPLAAISQQHLDQLPVAWNNLVDLYPLSPMQSGMLFHSLYSPQSTAYVNQLRVDITKLDAKRFRAAWQAMLDRHEMLRTGFIHGEKNLQWVARSVPLPFREIDWRHRADTTNALNELAAQELSQGVDLLTPPLMKFTLVHVDGGHHFIWTRHHVLLDGWSSSQLIAQVLSHYMGKDLPASKGRYRDYIAWLENKDGALSEAYWKHLFGRLESPTRLPATAGPESEDAGYLQYTYSLDKEKTARLLDFARTTRVTVNTLVQAAWALVLQCETGQATVSFGATSSGRSADVPGVEALLGLCINTIPVVVESSPGATVGQWLLDLQSQGLSSREHEHVPLFEMQNWAGFGGQSLFDSILVFENYPVDEVLRQSPQESVNFTISGLYEETHYPLTLIVTQGSTITIKAAYQGQVFSNASVTRWVERLARLLMLLTDSSERYLADLDPLTSQERTCLLGWRQACCNVHGANGVHRAFERQAQEHPDACALVFGRETLTYSALDRLANQVAHRLIRQGARPETRIGIVARRSIETIVGLLGILKTGGVYVPLDPEYPVQRLKYMVQSSGIAFLLAQGQCEHVVGASGVVPLALDLAGLIGEPEHAPEVQVHEDNLAYVLYTSGSTGRPKGVAMPHGVITRLVEWQALHMPGTWRTLLFASPCFDVSFQEIMSGLSSGATLIQTLETERRDFARLIALVSIQNVERIYLPFAVLQLFAEQALSSGTRLPALRQIITAGEQLKFTGALAHWASVETQCRIINQYGPTESHVVSNYILAADDEHELPSIGAPASSACLYVLDNNLQLAPAGASGELYIGSSVLARGYLNRPDLTAERFIADPFAPHGGRLYRSGDRARWRPDGLLEYQGRLDDQYKIRGYRVEVAEVEAQLLALPGIKEAAVVVRQGVSGPGLLAFVTRLGDSPLDAGALKRQLSEVLPDYMVPFMITAVDALPLSVNGKVDKKALHASGGLPEREYQAPTGFLETALAQIWGEALGMERVGREDNFFEMGGHSILALQVVMRAGATGLFNPPLAVQDLMRLPTIAALCGPLQAPSDSDMLLPLNKVLADSSPLFCIHSGWGTSLGYLPLAKSLNGLKTVYSICCKALSDPAARHPSLEAMADDYWALIRRVQPQGPYNILGWSLGGAVAVMMAARAERDGQHLSFLGLVDTYIPVLEHMTENQTGWQCQYPIFLEEISTPSGEHWSVPSDVCDPFESLAPLTRVTQDLLTTGRLRLSPDYEGLSALEIVRFFVANHSVRLARMASANNRLPALQGNVCCWWADDRHNKSQALHSVSEDLATEIDHISVNASHTDIIFNQAFLQGLHRKVL